MATVPAAPGAPIISDATPTSVVAKTIANDNGGLAIYNYEFGYSADIGATDPDVIVAGESILTISSLDPGTAYIFWARAQNSMGFSDWSAPTIASTIAGVRVKVGAAWKFAIPYVRESGVWKLAQPWVRVMGEWKNTI